MKSLLHAVFLSLIATMLTAAEPAPSIIEFAKLNPERGHRDCSSATPADVCRVRVQRTAAELRKHLAAGEPLWRSGDELSFAYEGEAADLEVSGGIQYPMSRVAGTNLWTLTVRVPELDRALLTYFFVPTKDGMPLVRRFDPLHWSGPRAIAEPEEVKTLAGKIVKRTIESKAMSMPRDLVIYEPPAVGDQLLGGVIYAGDGGAVDSFAKVLEPLIVSGRVPRILLVGMVSSTEDLGRAREYLLTLEDDNSTFVKHEQFFVDEVVPAIERDYALPNDAAHRATFGFSNSGAWAIDMALRHPQLIGRVLGFSPAGRKAAFLQPLPAAAPSFYPLGGTLEKPFHDKAVDWSRTFDAQHVTYTLREPVAGHDFAMWKAYFGDAVTWAFAGQAQTAQR
jgi:predicted esterase